MAHSRPGGLANHTENTEVSSAEPPQAGAPSQQETRGTAAPAQDGAAAAEHGLARQAVPGQPLAGTRPSSPSLPADLAAN